MSSFFYSDQEWQGGRKTSSADLESSPDARNGVKQKEKKTKTPPALISVFAKVGYRLHRPLTLNERVWLTDWFKRNKQYFNRHRRLSRGIAKRLGDYASKWVPNGGQVTDAKV